MAPRIMGSKATSHGPPNITMHSAGIYADMTVDGPEIGTLVLIVDRAKNLPNLRTVGKQDPYCAARLGKEAKKTETDKRGGQRPQWDQELRFTVHDSPDYHTLKVSVFNDDKKTDLIGECWVSLEDLLKPGGGQSDDWHHLNIKGRYAGEIRLELTYYDTRPKPEKLRKLSNAPAMELNTDAENRVPGPRQPIPRRPLPTFGDAAMPAQHMQDETHSRAASYPIPPTAPRSFPTPPRQQVYSDSFNSGSYPPRHIDHGYDYEDQDNEQYDPQQQFEQEPRYDNVEQYDPYSQSPSAIQDQRQRSHSRDQQQQQQHYSHYASPQDELHYGNSTQAGMQDMNYYDQPTVAPPAHHQVRRLSGADRSRPSLPAPMQHAHSAPQLIPQEMTNEPQYDYQDDGYNTLQPEANGYYNTVDRSYHHQPDLPRAAARQTRTDNAAPPPPPPAHRNSASNVTRSLPRPSPAQHSTPPSRALHISTTPSDFASHEISSSPQRRSPLYTSQNQLPLARGQPQQAPQSYPVPGRQQSRDDYATAGYTTRSGVSPSHLSHNADPMIRPRDELSHDPRRGYGSQSDLRDGSLDSSQTLGVQRPRPISYAGHTHSSPQVPTQHHQSSYQDSPPIVKPRAISPNARSAFSTPRKEVIPRPLPGSVSSTNAYSPDSFGALNPSHSGQSTPGYAQGRDPTPMYDSPSARRSQSQIEPQVSPSPDPIINADGTVTTPDGRTKDASEHLPASSYAPEPERKGADKARANTRVSIQNRFGPRDVGNTPPTSATASPSSTPSRETRPVSLPPIETRERLYRRTAAASGNSPSSSFGGGSPLSPADRNTINYNPPAYSNQSPSYPPPVPHKVPISPMRSAQGWMDDYEAGGEMKSLAGDLKMVNFKGDDDRIENGKGKTNGAGRLRKAKWSA